MKNQLAPGISLSLKTRVRDSDSARAYGSGLLEVYATPAMIAFMEKTAMECVQSYLSAGQGTVGTSVEVKHLKATAIGAAIECDAFLKEVNDRLLVFEVELREEGVVVGKGRHERFIIDEKKFIDKLKLR